MKTKVVFSFDTEDFTSNESADAIYTEAEILRQEGVRGCFCLVGLLAKQLVSWDRKDVLEALSFHEIDTHSYGHTLHPMINEYTDVEDFDAAKAEVIRQEKECLNLIRSATTCERVYAAVPPGNQKSYVAMYAYAEMGIPIYADTVCDTIHGDGVFYCNLYHLAYSLCVDGADGLFMRDSEEDMRTALDYLATLRHAIVYTHPHNSLFCEPWDIINYDKENLCSFGTWKAAKRHSPGKTEVFYKNMRKFVRMIQQDPRFEITTYEQIAVEIDTQSHRTIWKEDIPCLNEQLQKAFFPVNLPNSFCLADIFHACRTFLCGAEDYTCGEVYGFLAAPYTSAQKLIFTAEEITTSAAALPKQGFLPSVISVNDRKIGPADWLLAALEVLCGAEIVTILPNRPQLPALDCIPQTRDLSLKGTWRHSDSFEDRFLSDRLRWQSWTMRF